MSLETIKPDVKFPEMEREMLDFWQREKIFYRSVEQRRGCPRFSFYDGPPFANGLPHYGHILANTIKDVVPRYWAMKGFLVERRFGWDCHGVPVEYEIEKRDNLKGTSAIKELGVATFNDRCRESVLVYAKEWQKTITRLGRWVDWNNQYRTMDRSFMESVWWVFSELHKKGLVYKGHKVVHYSPRLGAVLSNFEANQNYQDVQDPSVTIKFATVDDPKTFFLVWTTTPWTLPANLGLAVGADFTYVKVRDEGSGENYILAEDRLEVLQKRKDAAQVTVLEKMTGKDLVGKKYQPLFPFFKNHPNAFQVFADNYVTISDGTGIVHLAPAFGEDDLRVCQKNGVALVDHLDEEGKFSAHMAEFSGIFFKDADKPLLQRLKSEGKVLLHETIVHSYPFCDRTGAPLIFRAVPAWYVAVEKLNERLVKNNQQIRWVPEHLRDGRMGKWLENARDWAVSRNRFWGTPLPVWECSKDTSHHQVMTSVAELEKLSGTTLGDIHKQHVDGLTFSCGQCAGTMKRVPEVFDCWFESGSMPYAQLHYPFEAQDKFKETFPADFIAEGLDQTRGWFYTLLVLSTALFDKPAFKNVIVNGIICDETGKKMSKRHRNYTPPGELLEKYGADATRLYMLNSPILRGEDLIFNDKGVVDTIRAVLLPLWNSLSFLSTYANAEGWKPAPSLVKAEAPHVQGEMDRWILSRLETTLQTTQQKMESYQLYAVVPPLLGFVDDLTNWYIRLSRRRFWGKAGANAAEKKDTTDAFATLYYVLLTFSKAIAPLAPFTAERVYQVLVKGEAGVLPSVHLCDYPAVQAQSIDTQLEADMDLVRRVTELGRTLRSKHQIKTRQPLARMTILTSEEGDKKVIEHYSALLKDELNVKHVEFSTDESRYLALGIKPNLKTLGRKLGAKLKDLQRHLESVSQNPREASAMIRSVAEKGWAFEGMTLTSEDFLITRAPLAASVVESDRDLSVLLDTAIDSSLRDEGLAREFVNRLQNIRKDLDFNVSDRIKVAVWSTEKVCQSLQAHEQYIAEETLSLDLSFLPFGSEPRGGGLLVAEIEGEKLAVLVEKAL